MEDLGLDPKLVDKSLDFKKVNDNKKKLYAALDLGTNSCRMLIARPTGSRFEIVDAFSKSIRLGLDLERTGELSQAGISRALQALHVCAKKLNKFGVRNSRLVATEACRRSKNGKSFLQKVKMETDDLEDVVADEFEDIIHMLKQGMSPDDIKKKYPKQSNTVDQVVKDLQNIQEANLIYFKYTFFPLKLFRSKSDPSIFFNFNSGVSPFFIPGALINLISGQVSIRHGFKGPNHAVSTACSTGAHSIGDAARLIINGDADVMLAGGSESPITEIGIAGFNACKALSTKFSNDPKAASRPKDKDRDGPCFSIKMSFRVLRSE